MTDEDILFKGPCWLSFVKMRLLFLGIFSFQIFLYYVVIYASLIDFAFHIPLFGTIMWSFNGMMNEIILISLLISILTFFIYYVCAIHSVTSDNEKIIIMASFFIFYLIFSLIFFPLSSQGPFYTLLCLSFLNIISVFLFFWGVNLYFIYKGLLFSFENKKNPSSLNETLDQHHAIIVINYQKLKMPVYGQGIDILIKSFKERNFSYKVYFCNDRAIIINTIRNNKATHLWIFGHGQRDGLRLPNNEFQYYHQIDFSDVEKKYFIGQFHCNPCIGECERSLAELIGIYGYVTNDLRDTLKNRKEIQTLVQIRKFG